MNTASKLIKPDKEANLDELERLIISEEFMDITKKSTEFLNFFQENYFEFDWAYAFIVRRTKPPRIITYQPRSEIDKILKFNDRIEIQSIVDKGNWYDFAFDFDFSSKEISIKEKDNEYFFFPIFPKAEVDYTDYYRQELPAGGFIFFNSKGSIKEQIFYKYQYQQQYQTIVRISNILYRDILLEYLTPSTAIFLKEGVRNLENLETPQKIIQDLLIKALHVGRTHWNWDIIASALLEIFEKIEIFNDKDDKFLVKIRGLLKEMLKELSMVEDFAKSYIKTCKKDENFHKPEKEVLKKTYDETANDDLKFLYHTRNFLKDFRLEYLNLSQVGAVTPQEVMAKSIKFLEVEIKELCEKVLEINRILFEHQS